MDPTYNDSALIQVMVCRQKSIAWTDIDVMDEISCPFHLLFSFFISLSPLIYGSWINFQHLNIEE